MSYYLPLPESLSAQGWKVKIRDKERVEPPHVSLIKKNETWRWGLRTRKFLDKKPPGRLVPKKLITILLENIEILEKNWDQMYPENPVNSGGKI